MSTENAITIIGNLTRDPELRYTQGGAAVASMAVAVNRRTFNRETNSWDERLDGYFDISIWRDYAENVAESLKKGDRVLVTGRLTKRSYTDREGVEKWVTEIEADEICPSLRWARAQISRVGRGSGGGGRPSGATGSAPMPQEPPTPDDVPF